MAKSRAFKVKQEKEAEEKKNLTIKSITELIENNKRVFEKNTKALEALPILLKANEDVLAAEKEKFEIQTKMIEIEIDNMQMMNPIQVYHTLPEWQTLFKRSKEFDKKEAAKSFEAAEMEFKHRKDSIEHFEFAFEGRRTTKEKIEAQQTKITEELPQYENQLKELEKPTKPD